ncbi:MAG: hypothetical protein IJC48_12480 [Clostridia bacterium]|nr:hypothetical protein [Clostridia bacterium]
MKKTFSKTVTLHYVKLIFRSLLLAAALSVYIYNRLNKTGQYFGGFESNKVLLCIIWLVFIAEMFMRFFPSRLESMGCQKQFSKNYIEIENRPQKPTAQPWLVTFSVAAAWIALNAVIGVLYYTGLIDGGILLLISLAYSVCDVVCILFFCPFQTWFMKNKCCGTCRIYNWDYAMMFTPLAYIPNIFAWSLLGVAVVLLIKWEYTYRRYPERFVDKCNRALSCAMCQEKLCHHKRQLQGFLRSGKFNLVGNQLMNEKNTK